MTKIKELKKMLEKQNKVIATHRGVDYSYIIPPKMMGERARKVNLKELTPVDIEYFINRLEKKSYPRATSKERSD